MCDSQGCLEARLVQQLLCLLYTPGHREIREGHVFILTHHTGSAPTEITNREIREEHVFILTHHTGSAHK